MLARLEKFKFDKEFFIKALSIAIPLMLQQLIVSSVNLIDNLMVGQLGDIALGGVTSVNKYYLIATFGVFGMTAAGSVFLSQYHGANNKERMKQSFRFMIISSSLISLLFFVIGFFFPENVLRFFTNDINVIDLGTKYFRIAIFTLIPIALTFSITSAMRTFGESKMPLLMSVVAVIINTFLNYCLIFGNFGFPNLGVEGAAIATLIARVIEMIIGLILLKYKSFEFNTRVFDLFKVDFSLANAIFLKAIPLCINEVLWSAGMATLFKYYSTRGIEVMAGSAISSTFSDIFFTLFGGMSITTTILVSSRLGANKLEEAKEYAYKLIGLSFVLSWFFAIAMFASSFLVPYIYANVSDLSKEVAIRMLQVQAVMYWIYMLTTECYFILRAGGDTKNTLMMDSGFMWLLNIPVLALVTYLTNWNYLIIYIIGQSVEFIKLSFAYKLLRLEKWVVNLTHQVK